MDGTASHSASAPSRRFCVCLIHVYLQAKGGRQGGVGARRGKKVKEQSEVKAEAGV